MARARLARRPPAHDHARRDQRGALRAATTAPIAPTRWRPINRAARRGARLRALHRRAERAARARLVPHRPHAGRGAQRDPRRQARRRARHRGRQPLQLQGDRLRAGTFDRRAPRSTSTTRKGVRHVFPVHNFDNAFGAAADVAGLDRRRPARTPSAAGGRPRTAAAPAPTRTASGWIPDSPPSWRSSASAATSPCRCPPTRTATTTPTMPAATPAACARRRMPATAISAATPRRADGPRHDHRHRPHVAEARSTTRSRSRRRATQPRPIRSWPPTCSSSLCTSASSTATPAATSGCARRRSSRRIKAGGGMIAAMLKDDVQDTEPARQEVQRSPIRPRRARDRGRLPATPQDVGAGASVRRRRDGRARSRMGSDFNGIAGARRAALRQRRLRRRRGVQRLRVAPLQELAGNRASAIPSRSPASAPSTKQTTGFKASTTTSTAWRTSACCQTWSPTWSRIGLDQHYVDALFCSAEKYIRVWERGLAIAGGQPVPDPDAEPWLCTSTGPVCGNGVLEAGEDCDDGNNVDGNGCSAVCTIEQGYACTGDPSACTPICGDGLAAAASAATRARPTARPPPAARRRARSSQTGRPARQTRTNALTTSAAAECAPIHPCRGRPRSCRSTVVWRRSAPLCSPTRTDASNRLSSGGWTRRSPRSRRRKRPRRRGTRPGRGQACGARAAV